MEDGESPSVIAKYLSAGLDQTLESVDGTFCVESLELENSLGEPVKKFNKGKPYRVAFTFFASEHVKNPLFKVSIRDQGTPLFHGDMFVDGAIGSFESGRYRLVCEFPELPLLPRGYTISFSVRSGNEFLIPTTDAGYF